MTNAGAQLGRVSLLATAMLLAACGTRYQAPLDDQSAVLDRGRAPIYSSTSQTSPSGVVVSGPNGASGVSESQPVIVGNSRSSTGAATGAGVRVTPAPGVSVNSVSTDTGIQRRSIDRAPVGRQATTAAPAPAPVIPPITAQTPPVQAPEPAPAPVPEPAPTPAPAPATNPSAARDYPDEAIIMPPGGQVQPQQQAPLPASHTVARGETLYSIAYQYSLDYRALAVANNLATPYTIYPNQQLSLNIGGVSNNSLNSVPAIPPAPAGDNEVLASGRPAEAMESRRMIDVPVRVVDDISWQWPVDGQVLRAYRADTTSISRGIDIGGKRGDPVYAAADGDVVYSGRGIQGQGNLIIIRHGARHLSAYSHNSSMLVSEGARIRAGDKIGEVGDDGRGTELLHFEVRVDGAPVDPAHYLPTR